MQGAQPCTATQRASSLKRSSAHLLVKSGDVVRLEDQIGVGHSHLPLVLSSRGCSQRLLASQVYKTILHVYTTPSPALSPTDPVPMLS